MNKRTKLYILMIVIFSIFLIYITFIAVFSKNTSSCSEIFSLTNCSNCFVLRITENTYNGPFLKGQQEKIWEIEAKIGNKTITSTGTIIQITSIFPDNIKLNFSGEKIYKDFKSVGNISIRLLINENLDSGVVGGGNTWEFIYYKK